MIVDLRWGYHRVLLRRRLGARSSLREHEETIRRVVVVRVEGPRGRFDLGLGGDAVRNILRMGGDGLRLLLALRGGGVQGRPLELEGAGRGAAAL